MFNRYWSVKCYVQYMRKILISFRFRLLVSLTCTMLPQLPLLILVWLFVISDEWQVPIYQWRCASEYWKKRRKSRSGCITLTYTAEVYFAWETSKLERWLSSMPVRYVGRTKPNLNCLIRRVNMEKRVRNLEQIALAETMTMKESSDRHGLKNW